LPGRRPGPGGRGRDRRGGTPPAGQWPEGGSRGRRRSEAPRTRGPRARLCPPSEAGRGLARDWTCGPSRALVWPRRRVDRWSDGEDVLLRDLQDRDAGGCLEEAAADHGVLHRQDAPAEAVVVPETALQCAVDEESQHSVWFGYKGSVGFIGVSVMAPRPFSLGRRTRRAPLSTRPNLRAETPSGTGAGPQSHAGLFPPPAQRPDTPGPMRRGPPCGGDAAAVPTAVPLEHDDGFRIGTAGETAVICPRYRRSRALNRSISMAPLTIVSAV